PAPASLLPPRRPGDRGAEGGAPVPRRDHAPPRAHARILREAPELRRVHGRPVPHDRRDDDLRAEEEGEGRRRRRPLPGARLPGGPRHLRPVPRRDRGPPPRDAEGVVALGGGDLPEWVPALRRDAAPPGGPARMKRKKAWIGLAV